MFGCHPYGTVPYASSSILDVILEDLFPWGHHVIMSEYYNHIITFVEYYTYAQGETMNKFELGETATIDIMIMKDNVLVDPQTVVISIYKPNREIAIDGVTMTRDSLGKYHYYYNSEGETSGILGIYKYKITSSSTSGYSKISTGTFEGINSY